MRRYQELKVAIGLRREPRLVFKNHLTSVQAARKEPGGTSGQPT
jgi:hypothetical protein